MSLLTIAVILGSALLGLFLIPGAMLFLGPSLPAGVRSVVARIQFTIGALLNERNVFVEFDDGQYRCCPARETADGAEVYHNGDWHDLDAKAWDRLGKRPFGITWAKTPDAFDVGTAVSPPGETEVDGDDILDFGVTDGIRAVGRVTKNWTVDAAQIATRYRDTDGSATVENSERITLEKEGGDTSSMNTTVIVIGVLVALAMGSSFAWLLFG